MPYSFVKATIKKYINPTIKAEIIGFICKMIKHIKATKEHKKAFSRLVEPKNTNRMIKIANVACQNEKSKYIITSLLYSFDKNIYKPAYQNSQNRVQTKINKDNRYDKY